MYGEERRMTCGFRVNSPDVIHQTIEDEVVLINLKTGTYYSLRDSGAAVWQAIEHGAGEDAIAAELQSRYDASHAEIRDAVGQLLAELQGEGLIRTDEREADQASTPIARANGSTLPFSAPVLEKHTDMQDLILLDPVHEVGAEGWPHPAPGNEDPA
jgi:Coenzyme PQQ synthesis protein D (PqqD)